MNFFFFILLFTSFSCEKQKTQTDELPTNLSLIERLEENPIRNGQAFHLLVVQDTEELASEFLESLKQNSLSLAQKIGVPSQVLLTEKILPKILRVDLGVNQKKVTQFTTEDNFTSTNHIEFPDTRTANEFLQVLEEKSTPKLYGIVLEYNTKNFLITKERKKLFQITPLQDIQFIVEKKGLSPEFLEEVKETSKIRDTLVLIKKEHLSKLQTIPERKIFILENFKDSNQSLILIQSLEKKETPRILFATKEDYLNTHELSPLEKEKFLEHFKKIVETKKNALAEVKKIKDAIQEQMTVQTKQFSQMAEKDTLFSFYLFFDFLGIEIAQTTEALIEGLESANILEILENLQQEYAQESIYSLYGEMFLTMPNKAGDENNNPFPFKNKDLFTIFSTYINNLEELEKIYPKSAWTQETKKALQDFLNYYKEKSENSE